MAANLIDRDAACALIETQIVKPIFQGETKPSAFLQLATRLPDMTSGQTALRVADILPTAYWVDGDTGQKKTSKAAWDKVMMYPGELAVIVHRVTPACAGNTSHRLPKWYYVRGHPRMREEYFTLLYLLFR